LVLVVGTILVLAGLVSRASAAGNTVVVTMTDKPARYVPEKITVRVGTTVEFRNTGQVVHDVTTDAAIARDKNDVSLPPNAKSFDSGFIPPGQSWSYTFTVPGRYLYACIPHEKDRMVGEVLVTK
jgi:plastocyanin